MGQRFEMRGAVVVLVALILAGVVAGCSDADNTDNVDNVDNGGDDDDGGFGSSEIRTCQLGGSDASCQVCQSLGDAACCPLTTPSACGTVASLQQFSLCQNSEASELCLVPAATGPSTFKMTNTTAEPVTVYMHFAAVGGACPASNPPIGPGDVPFCENISGLTCNFQLDAAGGANATRTFPTVAGKCLSGTFSFGLEVSCASPTGVTGAEYSLNVASGSQQTLNISLVNGWNHDIQIDVSSPGGGSTTLGPTTGLDTTNLVGVYPNGCDLCQSRGDPPCQGLFPALTPGTTNGCNAADTPCQVNPVPAGSTVEVKLLE
jgi:hypothetical protein